MSLSKKYSPINTEYTGRVIKEVKHMAFGVYKTAYYIDIDGVKELVFSKTEELLVVNMNISMTLIEVSHNIEITSFKVLNVFSVAKFFRLCLKKKFANPSRLMKIIWGQEKIPVIIPG